MKYLCIETWLVKWATRTGKEIHTQSKLSKSVQYLHVFKIVQIFSIYRLFTKISITDKEKSFCNKIVLGVYPFLLIIFLSLTMYFRNVFYERRL